MNCKKPRPFQPQTHRTHAGGEASVQTEHVGSHDAICKVALSETFSAIPNVTKITVKMV